MAKVNGNCFVSQIDLKLAGKLKSYLEEQEFEFSTPPYSIFSAKKSGISCTLYSSGKITVQGKDKDDFIRFFLEPEILGSVGYGYEKQTLNLTPRIGVDEAGKGDFFGPLCIAGIQGDAVSIPLLFDLGVKDSKKLSDNTVLNLSKEIKKVCPFHIISLKPLKYNELYSRFKNLNRLLAWGHASVIESLLQKTGCRKALIDKFGGEHLVLNAVKSKRLDIDLTQRCKAEEDIAVAAASILARAAFLNGLSELGTQFSIELPKGGSSSFVTEAGRELIRRHGHDFLSNVAKMHFKTLGEL